jgi:hypothetical protein
MHQIHPRYTRYTLIHWKHPGYTQDIHWIHPRYTLGYTLDTPLDTTQEWPKKVTSPPQELDIRGVSGASGVYPGRIHGVSRGVSWVYLGVCPGVSGVSGVHQVYPGL